MSQADAIGFIGLGEMGGPMVLRLLEAGREVNVYSRRRQSAETFVRAGAKWFASVEYLAKTCRRVFTIVGGPGDVEDIYLGQRGLVASAGPGSYLIDMTSSPPELARRIHSSALGRGVHTLDAPVTGGVPGARDGQLTFMAGGEDTALDAVRADLEVLGSQIFWMGPAGSGQMTKVCNQLAVAGIMLGMSEAIHCAQNSGISPRQVFEVLKTGTASSALLDRVGSKMIAGDETASFYVSHFIKDLEIATDTATARGLDLPAAQLCRRLYQTIAREGGGKKGIQALLDVYQNAQIRDTGQRETGK